MNILRTLKKITIAATVVASITKWRLGSSDLDEDIDVVFPVGCIGIKSDSKAWISKFQANNYALLVKNYSDLIAKYSLKDNDLFYGDDENYILFREGSVNIKSDQININCNDINITVANKIKINNVEITFVANKILINGKQVAVVGGDISTVTNKITTSGQ
jgi:hypothetical protein